MLSGVRMIGIGCLEKLLKVISILPRLALEVTLLVIMPLITAGGDRDSLGPPPHFGPLLSLLALLFAPLPSALSGIPQPLPGAAFLLF
jgi:hypothetical protein